MDRRLSDTPEDEAAQERKPKQTRPRKGASGASTGATKPGARKKASGSVEGSTAGPVVKPVAKKPRANSANSAKRREHARKDSLAGLAAQGFSEGEAARLLEVSARVAYSTEARESEAVMNRLRFTRWLIERGVINEFAV
jgi:hypothetical protein